MSVQCSFFVLNRDDPYDSHSFWPSSPTSGLVLDEPPAVGDLILLHGQMGDPDDPDGERMIDVSREWRVVARRWCPAAYGSSAWPHGPAPTGPILLDVMIEPSPGMFTRDAWS